MEDPDTVDAVMSVEEDKVDNSQVGQSFEQKNFVTPLSLSHDSFGTNNAPATAKKARARSGSGSVISKERRHLLFFIYYFIVVYIVQLLTQITVIYIDVGELP